MWSQMSTQPRFKPWGHGKERAAGRGLHRLYLPCGSVNALSHTDNLLGEVNVTDAERENLTNSQTDSQTEDCYLFLGTTTLWSASELESAVLKCIACYENAGTGAMLTRH